MEKFIENNLRPILLSIGGIILVCIVAAVISEVRSAHEAKAQGALWEAKQKADQLVAAKKLPEAVNLLQDVAHNYKGTHAAFDANLGSGDLLSQEKKYAEAVESYQAAASAAPDKFSKMLAVYNRGIAEEQSGKCDQAVKSYAEAEKLEAADFLAPELLMAEARCAETLGDKSKASSLYKEVREKFSNKSYYSSAATIYEQRLNGQRPN